MGPSPGAVSDVQASHIILIETATLTPVGQLLISFDEGIFFYLRTECYEVSRLIYKAGHCAVEISLIFTLP